MSDELTVVELGAILQDGQTLCGLDLGTKTIGIAVSDPALSLASPRSVIKRKKFTPDVQQLLTLAETERCGGFVVGLPLNMDGSEGPRAQATRAFVRNLRKLTELPIAFWDERLSTVAAERSLLEQDVSRAKRAERIDSAAAAFILQGALDRIYSAGVASGG
ncbi:MAG: Holliday junction resolvase RuvX [Pseudomonadota bacterium]